MSKWVLAIRLCAVATSCIAIYMIADGVWSMWFNPKRFVFPLVGAFGIVELIIGVILLFTAWRLYLLRFWALIVILLAGWFLTISLASHLSLSRPSATSTYWLEILFVIVTLCLTAAFIKNHNDTFLQSKI